MMWRRQPAVASPISAPAIVRAALGSALGSASVSQRLSDNMRTLLAAQFRASVAIGTDSGTSALVLALRAAVPRGGVVGFPGFACVDLAAAALFASVRVRLYDIDPVTLSPDLDSVKQLLARGADAIVVSHLYGYPADVPGVLALAAAAGVPTIEDAAQAAGGALVGKPLGSFGDLAVLSFGRGKGLCAGGGGALLGFGDRWEGALAQIRLPAPRLGWKGLATTAIQWALGRPSLYAVPSMIPGLHLGEMVYHPAHEPENLTQASVALLASALLLAPAALELRRKHANALTAAATAAPQLGVAHAIAGSEPGYLRYPIRDTGGRRTPVPSLGIVRSYPQTLAEQPQLAPILVPGEPPTLGSSELRRTLYTLPTHGFVTSADLAAMASWLGVAST